MNTCLHTGYLREHANRYQNGAGEALLFFTLLVRDERNATDVPHKMRVERYDLIQSYEPLLTPGRSMTVQSRSKSVPIMRHGLVKAETIAFEVERIEFHSRAAAREVERPAGRGVGTEMEKTEPIVAGVTPLDRALRELAETSDVRGDVGDSSNGESDRRRVAVVSSPSAPAAEAVPDDSEPMY